jgi:hypothetical protein
VSRRLRAIDVIDALTDLFILRGIGLPPEKWSSLKYGF